MFNFHEFLQGIKKERFKIKAIKVFIIAVTVKTESVFFSFLYIQFTLFREKNLQLPGTYISKRTWDPSQKTITK